MPWDFDGYEKEHSAGVWSNGPSRWVCYGCIPPTSRFDYQGFSDGFFPPHAIRGSRDEAIGALIARRVRLAMDL